MIKTIWVLVSFLGSDGHIPALQDELVYHDSRYSCHDTIKAMYRVLDAGENNYGTIHLSCRKAEAIYDDYGNVRSIMWNNE